MYPNKLKHCTHALRFHVIYAYHPVLGQGMQLQMMILKVKLRLEDPGNRKREIESNYEFH